MTLVTYFRIKSYYLDFIRSWDSQINKEVVK